MLEPRTRHDLAVCAAVLLFQLFGLPWLNWWWFAVAIENKTFPVLADVAMLTLVDIIPTASVFLVFGLSASRLFKSEQKFRWTIRCGVAAGFLWLLNHWGSRFAPWLDVALYLNFYIQSFVPLVFAAIGYTLDHLFRRAVHR